MLPPVIVNISRLHRETAAVVQQAERSDCPVFVTQYAYVTAVLLPRRMYDRLLRAAEKGAGERGAGQRGAGERGAGERRAGEWGTAEERAERGAAGAGEAGPELEPAGGQGQDSWATAASPLEGPLAVFGPLPPRTRFLTKYGLSVDAELAAFLMEEGEQVRPILERWTEPEDEES
jgi:hypothetical protein